MKAKMTNFHDETLKLFDEKFGIDIEGMWVAYTEMKGKSGEAFAPDSQTREDIKQFIKDRHLAYQNLLVERIEGMKNTRIYGIVGESGRAAKFKNQGYHSALSDIIALIKEV